MKLPSYRRVPAIALMLVASVALLAGCGMTSSSSQPDITLEPESRTPAAIGMAEVRQDSNDNNVLHVEVQHMPPPENLAPDRSTFVVWVQPTDTGLYYNVGSLQLDEERSAEIDVVTAFEDFDVIVTAEADPQALSPSEYVVLRTTVSNGEPSRMSEEEAA